MSWHKEPRRHALAAKGIKTAINPVHNAMDKTATILVGTKGVHKGKKAIDLGGGYIKIIDSYNDPISGGDMKGYVVEDKKHIFKPQKWDGRTDSKSKYYKLRQKGYSHDQAVNYIEKGSHQEFVVFKHKGKRLVAISVDGLEPGEIAETKRLIAYENKLKLSDIETKVEIDSDGDGIMDDLDCDPNDPKKQGFFDKLKARIQETREERVERKTQERQERIAQLRKEAEEREEKLEAEKEEKLLRLQSKVAERKAVAEIKAKEAELDNLQDEIEQLDGTENRKLAIQSTKQRLGKTLSRVKKRLIEEIKETPGRRTSIDLTKEELELTSPEKLRKLKAQQKKTANEQAKLELAKLQQEEAKIKAELSAINKKKKAKK